MYPKLKIMTDGKDPIEVETLPVDFMMYEEIQGAKPASEQGMRLTIAYYYVEGKEPNSMKTVKDWARNTKCMVEVITDSVDPTQPDHITD
jgi:hypothetical protein